MNHFTPQDLIWMRKAIALARRAEGMTRPNPPVGAILVRDGLPVGQGWHKKAGGPHAEVFALRQAGPAARGATAYVTLEPCSTTGRTPPCCDALIRAGVARVVASVADPNPLHAGRGFAVLRRAGIRAERGACAEEGAALIAPFASLQLRKRPLLTLKLGLTLDGRIADASHSSRWITGPAARDEVQALRRASDAILVGAGTLRADNPSLWPRPDRQRSPWRIVVAQNGPLPLSARLFTDEHSDRTLVAAPNGWHPPLARKLRNRGITVLELPPCRLLSALLDELGKLGLLRVLCEGGGILAGEFVRAGLADELIVYQAPLLLGGPVGAMGDTHWPLARAPRWTLLESRAVGNDWMFRFAPPRETP